MYKLKEVLANIWLVEFKDYNSLGMTFMRYQEYYESPNDKFFRKPFLIREFVEWYSEGKEFTYPTDWIGFNIPSNILLECQNNITDLNKWDRIMNKIISEITEKSKDNFYLIGIRKGDNDIAQHELAHGLYSINNEYRKEMDDLYNNLSIVILDKINNILKNSGGYSESVFQDETQAYMSTGLPFELSKNKSILKESKKFVEVFNKYSK